MSNANRRLYHEEIDETPLFMTQLPDDPTENIALEGLKALAYEGTPDEIALNFKNQGNEMISEKRWLDAKIFYNKSIQANPSIALEKKCLLNRTLCNLHLELRDEIEKNCEKAIWRLTRAYIMLEKLQDAEMYLSRQNNGDEFAVLRKLYREKLDSKQKSKSIKKDQMGNDIMLTSAIEARNITILKTGEQPDIQGITLESPLDASSLLFIPILILYPLVSQTDFFPSVAEDLQIKDLLEQIVPLPWDTKSEYKSPVVYVQGRGNKKVPVGKDIVLQEIFGRTVFVDGILRLYIVPDSVLC
ncbi:Hsp70/Hsp90 co-chaperone cns1 [Neolecta irregularis DAH-3]|uniref:Hsp70/Hsp90 co-chaperone cns1 n=1 Tax=Neolecta irregularis (strain DAH-3) TaxID=1198029 RepID=A0A1U7LJC5_NEOID|nr:Hsp70/Hsp90 co-chaperone cns1 [Neolecta irregularis DAH-3]|eukprot:OLL22755.1 Hsp70/Hsp90 co-chaperone cns1 [Neolecta irregularis DAH-3]